MSSSPAIEPLSVNAVDTLAQPTVSGFSSLLLVMRMGVESFAGVEGPGEDSFRFSGVRNLAGGLNNLRGAFGGGLVTVLRRRKTGGVVKSRVACAVGTAGGAESRLPFFRPLGEADEDG